MAVRRAITVSFCLSDQPPTRFQRHLQRRFSAPRQTGFTTVALVTTARTQEDAMSASDDLPTKHSLSADQQRFVELLQRIRYGRIPRLQVRRGRPVLNADLFWRRNVKVLGENAPHPSLHSPDFPLRKEVVEFFRLLAALGDGEVADLEVRNGLPFCFDLIEKLPG